MVLLNREVGVFGFHGFVGRGQHARRHRGVGALFDEDERAGQPVGAVAVEQQRFGGFQLDAADVVHGQGDGRRFRVQRVEIDFVFDLR